MSGSNLCLEANYLTDDFYCFPQSLLTNAGIKIINYEPCLEVWGSGGIASIFLTLALNRSGHFMPHVRYLWYPLDRRLGGPQSWSG
jgi:hypothetical protein